ncbi:MAG: hypothetical protein IPP68_08955 [Elusimicrobia bacterium]|nr:hypothetical protein [Elusimicrobiota bacterium]
MTVANVTSDLTAKLRSSGVSESDAKEIRKAFSDEAGAFTMGVDLKLTARAMENGTIEGARVRFEGDVKLVNDSTLNLGGLGSVGGKVAFNLTVDQGKTAVGDQIDLKLNGEQASTLIQKVQNNEIKLDGRPLEAILKELQNLEASGFKEMTVHITKSGEGDKVQTRETVSVEIDESKVSADVKAQWASRGIVAEGGVYSVSFRKNDEGRIDTLATLKADAVIGGQATGGVIDKTMVIDGTKRDVKAIELGNGLWRIVSGAETTTGNTFFARERKLVEGDFFDQVKVTPTIVYDEGGRATTVAFTAEAANPGGKFALPALPGQIFRGGAVEYNTITGQVTSSAGAERLTEVRKDGTTFHIVQQSNRLGGWTAVQSRPGFILGGDFRPTDGLALFAQNGLVGAKMFIDGFQVKINSSVQTKDGGLQLTFAEGTKDSRGHSIIGVKLSASLEVLSKSYSVTEPTTVNGVKVTPTNRLDLDRAPQSTSGGSGPAGSPDPMNGGRAPLGPIGPNFHAQSDESPAGELASSQLQIGSPSAALAATTPNGAAVVEVDRYGKVNSVTNAKFDLASLDTTSAGYKGNIRVSNATNMDAIQQQPDGTFAIKAETQIQIRDNAGNWRDVTAAAGGTIRITGNGAVFEGFADVSSNSALSVKRGGNEGGASGTARDTVAVLHGQTASHDIVSGKLFIQGDQIVWQTGIIRVENAAKGMVVAGYTVETDGSAFTLNARGIPGAEKGLTVTAGSLSQSSGGVTHRWMANGAESLTFAQKGASANGFTSQSSGVVTLTFNKGGEVQVSAGGMVTQSVGVLTREFTGVLGADGKTVTETKLSYRGQEVVAYQKVGDGEAFTVRVERNGQSTFVTFRAAANASTATELRAGDKVMERSYGDHTVSVVVSESGRMTNRVDGRDVINSVRADDQKGEYLITATTSKGERTYQAFYLSADFKSFNQLNDGAVLKSEAISEGGKSHTLAYVFSANTQGGIAIRLDNMPTEVVSGSKGTQYLTVQVATGVFQSFELSKTESGALGLKRLEDNTAFSVKQDMKLKNADGTTKSIEMATEYKVQDGRLRRGNTTLDGQTLVNEVAIGGTRYLITQALRTEAFQGKAYALSADGTTVEQMKRGFVTEETTGDVKTRLAVGARTADVTRFLVRDPQTGARNVEINLYFDSGKNAAFAVYASGDKSRGVYLTEGMQVAGVLGKGMSFRDQRGITLTGGNKGEANVTSYDYTVGGKTVVATRQADGRMVYNAASMGNLKTGLSAMGINDEASVYTGSGFATLRRTEDGVQLKTNAAGLVVAKGFELIDGPVTGTSFTFQRNGPVTFQAGWFTSDQGNKITFSGNARGDWSFDQGGFTMLGVQYDVKNGVALPSQSSSVTLMEGTSTLLLTRNGFQRFSNAGTGDLTIGFNRQGGLVGNQGDRISFNGSIFTANKAGMFEAARSVTPADKTIPNSLTLKFEAVTIHRQLSLGTRDGVRSWTTGGGIRAYVFNGEVKEKTFDANGTPRENTVKVSLTMDKNLTITALSREGATNTQNAELKATLQSELNLVRAGRNNLGANVVFLGMSINLTTGAKDATSNGATIILQAAEAAQGKDKKDLSFFTFAAGKDKNGTLGSTIVQNLNGEQRVFDVRSNGTISNLGSPAVITKRQAMDSDTGKAIGTYSEFKVAGLSEFTKGALSSVFGFKQEGISQQSFVLRSLDGKENVGVMVMSPTGEVAMATGNAKGTALTISMGKQDEKTGTIGVSLAGTAQLSGAQSRTVDSIQAASGHNTLTLAYTLRAMGFDVQKVLPSQANGIDFNNKPTMAAINGLVAEAATNNGKTTSRVIGGRLVEATVSTYHVTQYSEVPSPDCSHTVTVVVHEGQGKGGRTATLTNVSVTYNPTAELFESGSTQLVVSNFHGIKNASFTWEGEAGKNGSWKFDASTLQALKSNREFVESYLGVEIRNNVPGLVSLNLGQLENISGQLMGTFDMAISKVSFKGSTMVLESRAASSVIDQAASDSKSDSKGSGGWRKADMEVRTLNGGDRVQLSGTIMFERNANGFSPVLTGQGVTLDFKDAAAASLWHRVSVEKFTYNESGKMVKTGDGSWGAFFTDFGSKVGNAAAYAGRSAWGFVGGTIDESARETNIRDLMRYDVNEKISSEDEKSAGWKSLGAVVDVALIVTIPFGVGVAGRILVTGTRLAFAAESFTEGAVIMGRTLLLMAPTAQEAATGWGSRVLGETALSRLAGSAVIAGHQFGLMTAVINSGITVVNGEGVSVKSLAESYVSGFKTGMVLGMAATAAAPVLKVAAERIAQVGGSAFVQSVSAGASVRIANVATTIEKFSSEAFGVGATQTMGQVGRIVASGASYAVRSSVTGAATMVGFTVVNRAMNSMATGQEFKITLNELGYLSAIGGMAGFAMSAFLSRAGGFAANAETNLSKLAANPLAVSELGLKGAINFGLMGPMFDLAKAALQTPSEAIQRFFGVDISTHDAGLLKGNEGFMGLVKTELVSALTMAKTGLWFNVLSAGVLHGEQASAGRNLSLGEKIMQVATTYVVSNSVAAFQLATIETVAAIGLASFSDLTKEQREAVSSDTGFALLLVVPQALSGLKMAFSDKTSGSIGRSAEGSTEANALFTGALEKRAFDIKDSQNAPAGRLAFKAGDILAISDINGKVTASVVRHDWALERTLTGTDSLSVPREGGFTHYVRVSDSMAIREALDAWGGNAHDYMGAAKTLETSDGSVSATSESGKSLELTRTSDGKVDVSLDGKRVGGMESSRFENVFAKTAFVKASFEATGADSATSLRQLQSMNLGVNESLKIPGADGSRGEMKANAGIKDIAAEELFAQMVSLNAAVQVRGDVIEVTVNRMALEKAIPGAADLLPKGQTGLLVYDRSAKTMSLQFSAKANQVEGILKAYSDHVQGANAAGIKAPTDSVTVRIDVSNGKIGTLRMEGTVDPAKAASISALEGKTFEGEGNVNIVWQLEAGPGKSASEKYKVQVDRPTEAGARALWTLVENAGKKTADLTALMNLEGINNLGGFSITLSGGGKLILEATRLVFDQAGSMNLRKANPKASGELFTVASLAGDLEGSRLEVGIKKIGENAGRLDMFGLNAESLTLARGAKIELPKDIKPTDEVSFLKLGLLRAQSLADKIDGFNGMRVVGFGLAGEIRLLGKDGELSLTPEVKEALNKAWREPQEAGNRYKDSVARAEQLGEAGAKFKTAALEAFDADVKFMTGAGSEKARNKADRNAEIEFVTASLRADNGRLTAEERSALEGYREDLNSKDSRNGKTTPQDHAAMRVIRAIGANGEGLKSDAKLDAVMAIAARAMGFPDLTVPQKAALKSVMETFRTLMDMAGDPKITADQIAKTMEVKKDDFRMVQLLGTGAGKTILFAILTKLVHPLNTKLGRATFVLADTPGNVDNNYSTTRRVWGNQMGIMLKVTDTTDRAEVARVAREGGVLFMTYGTLAGLRINDLRAEETGTKDSYAVKDRIGVALCDEVDAMAFIPATISGGSTRGLVSALASGQFNGLDAAAIADRLVQAGLSPELANKVANNKVSAETLARVADLGAPIHRSFEAELGKAAELSDARRDEAMQGVEAKFEKIISQRAGEILDGGLSRYEAISLLRNDVFGKIDAQRTELVESVTDRAVEAVAREVLGMGNDRELSPEEIAQFRTAIREGMSVEAEAAWLLGKMTGDIPEGVKPSHQLASVLASRFGQFADGHKSAATFAEHLKQLSVEFERNAESHGLTPNGVKLAMGVVELGRGKGLGDEWVQKTADSMAGRLADVGGVPLVVAREYARNALNTLVTWREGKDFYQIGGKTGKIMMDSNGVAMDLVPPRGTIQTLQALLGLSITKPMEGEHKQVSALGALEEGLGFIGMSGTLSSAVRGVFKETLGHDLNVKNAGTPEINTRDFTINGETGRLEMKDTKSLSDGSSQAVTYDLAADNKGRLIEDPMSKFVLLGLDALNPDQQLIATFANSRDARIAQKVVAKMLEADGRGGEKIALIDGTITDGADITRVVKGGEDGKQAQNQIILGSVQQLGRGIDIQRFENSQSVRLVIVDPHLMPATALTQNAGRVLGNRFGSDIDDTGKKMTISVSLLTDGYTLSTRLDAKTLDGMRTASETTGSDGNPQYRWDMQGVLDAMNTETQRQDVSSTQGKGNKVLVQREAAESSLGGEAFLTQKQGQPLRTLSDIQFKLANQGNPGFFDKLKSVLEGAADLYLLRGGERTALTAAGMAFANTAVTLATTGGADYQAVQQFLTAAGVQGVPSGQMTDANVLRATQLLEQWGNANIQAPNVAHKEGQTKAPATVNLLSVLTVQAAAANNWIPSNDDSFKAAYMKFEQSGHRGFVDWILANGLGSETAGKGLQKTWDAYLAHQSTSEAFENKLNALSTSLGVLNYRHLREEAQKIDTATAKPEDVDGLVQRQNDFLAKANESLRASEPGFIVLMDRMAAAEAKLKLQQQNLTLASLGIIALDAGAVDRARGFAALLPGANLNNIEQAGQAVSLLRKAAAANGANESLNARWASQLSRTVSLSQAASDTRLWTARGQQAFLSDTVTFQAAVGRHVANLKANVQNASQQFSLAAPAEKYLLPFLSRRLGPKAGPLVAKVAGSSALPAALYVMTSTVWISAVPSLLAAGYSLARSIPAALAWMSSVRGSGVRADLSSLGSADSFTSFAEAANSDLGKIIYPNLEMAKSRYNRISGIEPFAKSTSYDQLVGLSDGQFKALEKVAAASGDQENLLALRADESLQPFIDAYYPEVVAAARAKELPTVETPTLREQAPTTTLGTGHTVVAHQGAVRPAEATLHAAAVETTPVVERVPASNPTPPAITPTTGKKSLFNKGNGGKSRGMTDVQTPEPTENLPGDEMSSRGTRTADNSLSEGNTQPTANAFQASAQQNILAPVTKGLLSPNATFTQKALYWSMGGIVMPFAEEVAFRHLAFSHMGQQLFDGGALNLGALAGNTVLFGALFAAAHSAVEIGAAMRTNGGGLKGFAAALKDSGLWKNFASRLVFSTAMTGLYLAASAAVGPVAALLMSSVAHGLWNLPRMMAEYRRETGTEDQSSRRSRGAVTAAAVATFLATLSPKAWAGLTNPNGEVASVAQFNGRNELVSITPIPGANNGRETTVVLPSAVPQGALMVHSHPGNDSTMPSLTDLQEINGQAPEGLILNGLGQWTYFSVVFNGGTAASLVSTPPADQPGVPSANPSVVSGGLPQSGGNAALAYIEITEGAPGTAPATSRQPLATFIANGLLNGEPVPTNAEHTPFFDKVLGSLQSGVDTLEEDLAANRLTLEELRRQIDQSQRAVQGNPMTQLHATRAFLEKSPLAPSAAYAALANDAQRFAALRALNIDSTEIAMDSNDLKAKAAKLNAALDRAKADRLMANLIGEAAGRAYNPNLFGRNRQYTEAALTAVANKVFLPLFARTLGVSSDTPLPELKVGWDASPSKANAARSWMISRWADNTVRNDIDVRGTDRLALILAVAHESAHAGLMAAWGRPLSQESLDMEALAGALMGVSLKSRADLQPLAQFEEVEARSFAGRNRPELWRAREIAHGLLAKALALGVAKGREVRATLAAAQQDGGLLAMALGVGLGKTPVKSTEPLVYMVSASDLIARNKVLEQAATNIDALARNLRADEGKVFRIVVVNNLAQRQGDWLKVTKRLKGVKGVSFLDKSQVPAGAIQDRTNKVVLDRLMPKLAELLSLSRDAKLRIALLTGARESWIADLTQVLVIPLAQAVGEFMKAIDAMKVASQSA